MQAIEIHGLVKDFGGFRALNELDLVVEAGEVHGFLGPNGAGKSTTIRVLLGLLRKTAGDVRLLDGDPWRDAVKLHRRLAYVPGDVDLWPNLSGGEAIDLIGRLRGGLNKDRRTKLIDDFELDPRKKCGTYSKGNRQKVAIIAALASDVELYVLDEPTAGLDPLMQSIFQAHVQKLKEVGKTILLSSHILAEVEALCERVTIIKEGKVVESGVLGDLRRLSFTAVNVETEKPVKDLDKLGGVQDVLTEGNHASFKVNPDKLNTVLAHITKFNVRAMTSAPPTLEELFMRHYDNEVKE